GTDAGVEPHGTNAKEFSLMVENGLKPAEALMAATHNGADLLGVSDTAGALVADWPADIVAVPGNPLSDISVTARPLMVMKGGYIVVGAPD
ncbi:MAG: amidohydrolase family protein, partial [Lysobacterales bacterium]